MAKKLAPIAFEAALAELEQMVGQLEQGELPLDEALQRFEQGVALTRTCQTALRQAEQKVEQLLEAHGELVIVPFNAAAG
ncbi:MAG: exodeoxyribonuclease VII small subunit [Candidatus Contendobacter sp.]|nr:exodeoxyribonuclease VII small subunit [Gammaproteobacteria bacterium]MCC8994663.1 exodeoxyribonuclease VII small subunit [Candidatus Contendobacter sp.]